MKLDKKTLRSLSLAFFISGLILAGANIFADNSSAQTESSENTENYQVADNLEEETGSIDTEANEEDSNETSHDESNLDEETEETEELVEENADTSSPNDTNEEDIENEDTTDDADAEEETDNIIEFVVNPNEDSYSVVDKLVQVGIIENEDEFNEFLDYYDYARRIQPGTKELSPAMSYEEIAQILTTY